jgi:CHASE2 domain-containing sensor protein
VHAAPDAPVRRRPPVPALLAVPFAVLSALAVAFFGFIALAFSNGDLDDGVWLFIAVPAVLSAWLLVGALLLLLGRSWLAVFLPAAGLGVMVIWGILVGALGADNGAFLVLVWTLPIVTAVLAVLPGVRRWVTVRRRARRAR